MIYTIEQYASGKWNHVRHLDGLPLMFASRQQAQAVLKRLEVAKPFALYRITKVND